MTNCCVGGSCRCFTETKAISLIPLQISPVGKTIMSNLKLIQYLELEFTPDAPVLKYVYKAQLRDKIS